MATAPLYMLRRPKCLKMVFMAWKGEVYFLGKYSICIYITHFIISAGQMIMA